MKNLNEFTSGYSQAQVQSPELPSVFSPVDAETVQGKDRLNPLDTEGLHRINVFLKHFFRKTTLNPQYDLAQLRVRLNHLGLDFEINALKKIDKSTDIEVTKGNVFGVLPTTDLSKGFYKGEDLPKFNLKITLDKVDSGYKIDAVLTPKGSVTESLMNVKKRNKRINTLKELYQAKIAEMYEIAHVRNATDITNKKQEEIKKSRKRDEKKLKGFGR